MIIIRIWHKDFIKVLPREQLVAQWREISALAGSIQKNGTPNHILVNFIMDYDFDHFISYAYYVREEMTRRGYRTMDSVWQKIVALKPQYTLLSFDEIYPNKMNGPPGFEYLTICLFNLKEKYMCGGFSEQDWNNIQQVYMKKSAWR